MEISILSGLMQPLSNFVGNLGYVSVCLLGGFLAGVIRLRLVIFKPLSNMYANSINQLPNLLKQ